MLATEIRPPRDASTRPDISLARYCAALRYADAASSCFFPYFQPHYQSWPRTPAPVGTRAMGGRYAAESPGRRRWPHSRRDYRELDCHYFHSRQPATIIILAHTAGPMPPNFRRRATRRSIFAMPMASTSGAGWPRPRAAARRRLIALLDAADRARRRFRPAAGAP